MMQPLLLRSGGMGSGVGGWGWGFWCWVGWGVCIWRYGAGLLRAPRYDPVDDDGFVFMLAVLSWGLHWERVGRSAAELRLRAPSPVLQGSRLAVLP